MATTSESLAFDRGVRPMLEIVLPEKADAVIAFQADPDLQARIEELARKSTEGELTEDERAEYAGYVRANKFVATLKRQAQQIAEGLALLEKALKSQRFGPYTLQAAIAAVHAEAESAAVTDWRKIVSLYNQLLRIHPSPVVQLNRAVAIAMRDGPEAGLAQIDEVLEHGELANYYPAHSARADMYRRLGRTAEARSSLMRELWR